MLICICNIYLYFFQNKKYNLYISVRVFLIYWCSILVTHSSSLSLSSAQFTRIRAARDSGLRIVTLAGGASSSSDSSSAKASNALTKTLVLFLMVSRSTSFVEEDLCDLTSFGPVQPLWKCPLSPHLEQTFSSMVGQHTFPRTSRKLWELTQYSDFPCALHTWHPVAATSPLLLLEGTTRRDIPVGCC